MLRFTQLKKSPGKYNNKKTIVDGFTFDSRKEADYYSQLKLLQRAGKVHTFLRQTPFHLPGGVKYVADFMVFHTNGDVKGVRTAEYKTKKKLVEYYYPITVIEV